MIQLSYVKFLRANINSTIFIFHNGFSEVVLALDALVLSEDTMLQKFNKKFSWTMVNISYFPTLNIKFSVSRHQHDFFSYILLF